MRGPIHARHAPRSPHTRTDTVVQRRTVVNALPLPATLGRLAGTTVPHAFVAVAPTEGLPWCRECFGFCDDVRHL